MVQVSGAAAAVATRSAPRDIAPKFYVSKGKIVGVSILALLLLIGLYFYYGPMRVSRQWEALSPGATNQVSDVVTFALQAYLSEKGLYDPSKAHQIPRVEGDVHWFQPLMAITMPQGIGFIGKTNQGNFSGNYHPATGEIDATVAYGGYSFGGLIDIAKATGQIKITGREVNGQPQAEVDGQALHIVYPPKDAD